MPDGKVTESGLTRWCHERCSLPAEEVGFEPTVPCDTTVFELDCELRTVSCRSRSCRRVGHMWLHFRRRSQRFRRILAVCEGCNGRDRPVPSAAYPARSSIADPHDVSRVWGSLPSQRRIRSTDLVGAPQSQLPPDPTRARWPSCAPERSILDDRSRGRWLPLADSGTWWTWLPYAPCFQGDRCPYISR